MAESPTHLFVYGTLRRGQPEMERLLAADAVPVGHGTVQGRLYLIEDFPGAIDSPYADDQIHGEVYLLRDAAAVLARLDDYEDFDPNDPDRSLFVRRLAEARLSNGRRLPAWVYFYNRPVGALPPIPSGDFLDVHRAARRARA